jgi:hypothetical protein
VLEVDRYIGEPLGADGGLDGVGYAEHEQRVEFRSHGPDWDEQAIERLPGPAEPEIEETQSPPDALGNRLRAVARSECLDHREVRAHALL